MAAWLKRPEVEWDGETPLCVDGSDTFFFHADELGDYLVDIDETDETSDPDSLIESVLRIHNALEWVRLLLCRESPAPHFDLCDHLYDHDEEIELDAEGQQLEAAVNAWIAKQRKMWTPANERPSVVSVLRALGIEEAAK